LDVVTQTVQVASLVYYELCAV